MSARHTPLIVAHRGASAEAPEHTLAAFQLAIDTGADGLECDVRLTADHQLVCLHDRRLERTSNGKGAVSNMTRAELEKYDYGSWKASELTHSYERLPEEMRSLLTLRRLLETVVACERPLLLLIETKHPTRYGPALERNLAGLLHEFGLADGGEPGGPQVRVMSFSHIALRRMAHLRPRLPLVHLLERKVPTPTWQGWLPWGVRQVGLDIAGVRRDHAVVARHRAHGHQVAVWTVDEPADIQLCLDLEVDVIITNRPSQALAARAAWLAE